MSSSHASGASSHASGASSLRCPLCGITFVVRSEAECEAHIAVCPKFHSQYGVAGPRAGLVSGLAEAMLAAANDPLPPATRPPLELACDAYGALLAPIVAVAKSQQEGRTDEEAVDLVLALASILVTMPCDGAAGFGLEEMLSLSLGPYLSEVPAPQCALVRAALPQAIEAVRRAMPSEQGGGELTELLRRALLGGPPPEEAQEVSEPAPPLASSTLTPEALAEGIDRLSLPIDDPDGASSAAGKAASHPLGPHRQVVLHGLSSRADLNGRRGMILGAALANGRWPVRVFAPSESPTAATLEVTIRPANLTPFDGPLREHIRVTEQSSQ